MADNPTVPVNLMCHCTQLRVTVHVPQSSLPLPITFCHCNTCNAVTGQLCATVAGYSTSSPGRPLEITGKATGYRTSSALERFFCPDCGTSVYEDAGSMSEGMVFLDTGAMVGNEVEIEGEGGGKKVKVAEVGEHIFVGDTGDGGMRDWMTDVKAWEGWMDGRSKEVEKGKYFGKGRERVERAEGEVLKCECHCGGVSFGVVEPEGKGRYRAVACACNDCRLASGYDISAWAVVPRGNFVSSEGQTVNFDELSKVGTMKQYTSSKGNERGFCSKCGATVSWNGASEPDTVDVAAGLVRKGTRAGSRVQDWLEWQGHLAFKESAQKQAIGSMLDEGLKAWSKAD